MDVSDFQAWQVVSPNRSVDIKIYDDYGRGSKTTIWVYDTSLPAGQYVGSVEEIDLESAKEKFDRAQYEMLRKKYEEKEGK